MTTEIYVLRSLAGTMYEDTAFETQDLALEFLDERYPTSVETISANNNFALVHAANGDTYLLAKVVMHIETEEPADE